MKILIYGLPKTGTTGLYFLIKNSQNNEGCFLFEPDYNTLSNALMNHDSLLVKTLVGQRCEALFDKFDKKILIIRDPRDWVISSFLYSTALHKIYDNNLFISVMLNLLSKKQKDTLFISFQNLVKYEVKGQLPWKDNIYLSDILFNNLINYHKQQQNTFFIFKYEDFIQRNLSQLEQYLGIKLIGSSDVSNDFKRVERTKNYGDWKKWFTPDDVEYFKPIFKEYMDYFGYTDWELPVEQIISPSHGSTYVLRLVSEARKGKLSPYKTSLDEKLTKRLFSFDWITYLLNHPDLVSKGIYTKWGVIIKCLLLKRVDRQKSQY